MTGSRATTKTISYRRNRDHKKQFNSTYELNNDLLDCYTKAREDPSKGYMKKIKNLWDTLRPELIILTKII